MKRIAIVGSGAAGLTAAYLLNGRAHITLFEKDATFGGHVHTVTHTDHHGDTVELDTGFMVFNDHTYPNLERLFEQLGSISVGNSDMSFGYYNHHTGIQYAINFDPKSEFSKSINLSDTLPKDSMSIYRSILVDFLRFSKTAIDDLNAGRMDEVSLGDYLIKRNVSDTLKELYLFPMASAIWSTDIHRIFDYPAANLFSFFKNHGLISLGNSIKWKYVVGGAKTYVKKIISELKSTSEIHASRSVISISRSNDKVTITSSDGQAATFDFVIIATHANDALMLLNNPDEDEKALLGVWKYQQNDAVLHTDETVMPPNKAAWASWNYAEEGSLSNKVSVTYHLNRLQNHTVRTNYFLSLNRSTQINADKIIKRLSFTHPTYSFDALRSQKKISARNGLNRTFFCGSYLGNGFHEDAVTSAFNLVEQIGSYL